MTRPTKHKNFDIIKKLRQQGNTYAYIATQMSVPCSAENIRKICIRYNIQLPNRKRAFKDK